MGSETDPWAAAGFHVTPGPGQGELVVQPPAPGTDPVVLPPGAGDQAEFAKGAKDFGLAAADTASFGVLPRATAGYSYATGSAPSYTKALDESLKTLREARERSPWASVAGDFAGSVPGGVAAGGRATGSIGRRAGYGALGGAGIGGLQGLLHTYSGVPEDYFGDAALGAVSGGMAGILTPVIGPAVGRGQRTLANRTGLPDPAVRAAQTAEPNLRPAMARADQVAATGAPFREMFGDVDPALLGTTQGAGLGTGPGTARLIRALQDRQDTSPAFMTQQATAIMGPTVIPRFEQEGVRRQMTALQPYYDRVLNGPNVRAVDTEPIANWLETVTVNDRGARQTAAARLRGMLDVTGNPGALDPHPRTLQAVRSEVNSVLRDRELSPAERALYEEADRRMTAELQAKVPGIRQIDSHYAELGSQERALGTDSPGSRMFDKGRTGATHPQELERLLTEAGQLKGSMTYTQEPLRLEQAARYQLERIIGTNANDVAALRTLLGRPQDWNSQKLTVMFGPQRAQQLLDVVEREYGGQNTFRKVVENSQTAQRLAAAKEQEASVGGLSPTSTMWGRGEQLLKHLYDQARGQHNQAVRDRIAEIMATRDPAAFSDMGRRLLATGAARDRNANVANLIAQRAFMSAGAGVIPKNLVPEQ